MSNVRGGRTCLQGPTLRNWNFISPPKALSFHKLTMYIERVSGTAVWSVFKAESFIAVKMCDSWELLRMHRALYTRFYVQEAQGQPG